MLIALLYHKPLWNDCGWVYIVDSTRRDGAAHMCTCVTEQTSLQGLCNSAHIVKDDFFHIRSTKANCGLYSPPQQDNPRLIQVWLHVYGESQCSFQVVFKQALSLNILVCEIVSFQSHRHSSVKPS